MITIIILTFIIFVIVMVLLSISLIAKGQPIRRTCGSHQHKLENGDGPCDTCCCSAAGQAEVK